MIKKVLFQGQDNHQDNNKDHHQEWLCAPKPEDSASLFSHSYPKDSQTDEQTRKDIQKRYTRGRHAYYSGLKAEQTACILLHNAGWDILLQRARTPKGEIDIVARQTITHQITQQKEIILCFIEVKKRRSLTEATLSLSPQQCARLFGAAECLLQHFTEWSYNTLRFDLIGFDQTGKTLWLQDIIRCMEPL
ncbi:MAG: YraN family protein [Acetobacter sp.]|nr:YraN family protein [Acetobacter sp.]